MSKKVPAKKIAKKNVKVAQKPTPVIKKAIKAVQVKKGFTPVVKGKRGK